MYTTNQILDLIEQVEKNPEYKISEQEAKGFLSKMKGVKRKDNYASIGCHNNGLYKHAFSRIR